MKTMVDIDRQILEILKTTERPVSICGAVDTCALLFDLASAPVWNETELDKLDFISKRLDINKKLFVSYETNGGKMSSSELTDQRWLGLCVAILLKVTLLTVRDSSVPEVSLKRFNVLFKSMDVFTPKWLEINSVLREVLESEWRALLESLPLSSERFEIAKWSATPICHEFQGLKVVPLTVLFYEGPIARAYLETIKSLGLKPQKIIELVAAKDIATHKSVGNWLPKGMRKSYAATIQRRKIHYWSKQLLKSVPDLVRTITDEVGSKLGFTKSTIDDANTLLPLMEYSACVETLLVDGLGDKQLYNYLSDTPAGTILYTGGGIVPALLLAIRHLKFLHIHPGFLPNIRGADCALWSSLLTGHASATCFYMSPDIDTGDIILPCWLPKLCFNIEGQGINVEAGYRAVYGFLDPWVRAFAFREVLSSHVELSALDCIPQVEEDGITFHFMHERLRQSALTRLFE